MCSSDLNRSYIRFVKVCAHSRDIAYIIAYIIRDNRRVSGIILRNSRFYLSDQVCAHISGMYHSWVSPGGIHTALCGGAA